VQQERLVPWDRVDQEVGKKKRHSACMNMQAGQGTGFADRGEGKEGIPGWLPGSLP
jgi:hypothetical protein